VSSLRYLACTPVSIRADLWYNSQDEETALWLRFFLSTMNPQPDNSSGGRWKGPGTVLMRCLRRETDWPISNVIRSI